MNEAARTNSTPPSRQRDPAMALVVGFDGGGTKTVCLLARAVDGTVLGRGTGGPANIHAVGAERAGASLATAARAACAAAGYTSPDAVPAIAVVVLGCAGADRPTDQPVMEALLRAVVAAERYIVVNDGAIALRAALPAGPGALVIAGTGSIGYGRDVRGHPQRAGGWGYLLDDAGSAYAVGLAGLMAVLRAHDGRAAPTALTAPLLAAWSLTAPEELIGRVYRLPPPREEIAALAPLVLATARAGDSTARAIVDAAGTALGELAAATIRKLGLPAGQPARLVTTGGFMRAGADLLVPPLLSALQAQELAVTHEVATIEAALGAVALAREAWAGAT